MSRSISLFCGIRRSRVVMDLNLQKSRSAGTGAAPVLAVQVDQLVLAVASVLESDGLSLVQQRLYLKVTDCH